MIRFSCPGCGAVYNVDDSKGGKTGKCPKCQTQFQIPVPEGAAAPPPVPASAPGPPATLPPPPATDPNAPVEIEPCPKCQARLSVASSDLGVDVECPYCKTVYTATRAGAAASPSKAHLAVADDRPSRRRRDDEEGEDRPSRRRRDEDDEDDRPSRRRRRDEEDEDEEERPSRRRRDEDEAEERPRRKRRRGADVESKRIVAGVLALLLGGWGVHKFYLGYTTAGVIQLLLTLFTCTGGIIALIEGIIYLTKSDEEFIETYQLNEKQWF
jgi:predicted Zn finger-like uncharacterized protein